MNSSCPMGAFDQGPSHIPWTIRKSKLSLQTTVKYNPESQLVLQTLKSLFNNPDIVLPNGIIFVDNVNEINNIPSKINEDVRFVDTSNWRVYECYEINKKVIQNELGFFNESFHYVSKTDDSIIKRRSDFQGISINLVCFILIRHTW